MPMTPLSVLKPDARLVAAGAESVMKELAE